MRRYYGNGYHDEGRLSIVGIIALIAACVAVGLSVFVIVTRKPAPTSSVANRNPASVSTAMPEQPASPPTKLEIPENRFRDTTFEAGPTQRPVPQAARQARPASCRNSTNPACGRFFWSPAAAHDAPLRLDVSIFPANPVAGEEVTFTVTAKDGDARIVGIFQRFGDGDGGPTHIDCPTPQRYGPWTPPARRADQRTVTFRHVYAKAGSYKASFSAQSGECGSPYADIVTLPVDMVVEASSSPSPSPASSSAA